MRKWTAYFKDELGNADVQVVETGDLGAEALKRFDAAWNARSYNGREVFGMWIIDYATERADVIRLKGDAPPEILVRHKAWKE